MSAIVVSYATALLARDIATIEADLLASLQAPPNNVQIAGFGDFSVQRALPNLQARAQAQLEALRVQLVQAGVATTAYLAGDDWVDVTLGGFFFETRIPASKSQVRLQISAAGSPLSAAAGAWVAQADDGTLFANVDPISVAANGVGGGLFECRSAGIVGNAPQGTISHLVVGPPGASVSNGPGSLVVAGRDAETSADYLVRCIGKWGTQGKGGNALAFYYWIPKFAPTITRILIRDDNPAGPGSIGVCLANAAGPATPDEVQDVANGLGPIKPLGSGLLQVTGAAPQVQFVAGVLYGDGTNPNLDGDAIDALERLQATYPIGSLQVQALYRAKLDEVLMEIPGMRNVKLTVPSADVPLAPYAVIQLVPAFQVAP